MALFLPPSRGFSEKDFDGLPQLSKLSPADMQRIKSVYSAGNFPGGMALPFALYVPCLRGCGHVFICGRDTALSCCPGYPAARGGFSDWWWMAAAVASDKEWGLGHCSVRRVARALVAGGTPVVYSYGE